MNWEALGALADLIGAAGVIGSLLYLAVQVRTGNRASAGHFQFRQHTLTESDWFEIRAVLDYWLGSRGCIEWWNKLGRSMYGTEFVAFIDAEIPRLVARQGAAAGAERPSPSETDDPMASVTRATTRSGSTEPHR